MDDDLDLMPYIVLEGMCNVQVLCMFFLKMLNHMKH